MSNLGTCIACNNISKLGKSHIIPKSFFKGIIDGNKPAWMIKKAKGTYPKKNHKGVYDDSILCLKCEDIFQSADNFAYKFFFEKKHRRVRSSSGNVAYEINSDDVKRLRHFIISLLWRCSVSKHEFFEKVSLGPYENHAKELTWDPNKIRENDFEFFITKFKYKKWVQTVHEPYRFRINQINYTKIFFKDFVIYIKVDKRMPPWNFHAFSIKEGKYCFMPETLFEDSPDYQVMVSTAKYYIESKGKKEHV